MKIFIVALAAFSTAATPLLAQEAAPMQVQRVGETARGNAYLPANTEILLEMNQDVTTKGKTWAEGDTFNLSVVHDVTLGDFVVIPQGSKAVGRITWLTSKGMFGKSGKMDIELEYVEVQGRRIALEGTYRQEGEGNTLATVGGVVLAGVFAGFITGKSAVIPQGRELMATTESDLQLAVAASEIEAAPSVVAPLANTPRAQLAARTEVAAPIDGANEAAVLND